MLREDNADLRLTAKGRALGVVDDHRWQCFDRKQTEINQESKRLLSFWIQPKSDAAVSLANHLDKPLSREFNAAELIKRPELAIADVYQAIGFDLPAPQVLQQLEVAAKYAGYIERQQDDIDKLRSHEATPLPQDLDFSKVNGLSNEVKQKLAAAQPETLGRASRVPGVTPAAISLLLIYLKKTGMLHKPSVDAKDSASTQTGAA